MPIQGTEIDVDRIILTFINFVPLTDSLDLAAADLILEFIDHVAVIGFIHTVDPGLKVITSLDIKARIFSGDQTVFDPFGKGHQTFAWCRAAIFHFG